MNTWQKYKIILLRNNIWFVISNKALDTSDLESDIDLPKKRKRVFKKFCSFSSIECEAKEDRVLLSPPQLHTVQTEILENTNNLDYQYLLQKILQKQNIITGILSSINEKIKHIDDKCQSGQQDLETTDSIFNKFDFPINTEFILSEFEQYLKNENEFNKTVKELSKLGGSNEYHFVSRIMEKIMTNSLASHYSYLGKKQRKNFLLFHQIILKTGLMAFSQKTHVVFEQCIAKWLRRAKE
ncbi:hypothetical protein RN001_006015 [Aquatica leii]|uniref:DUF4806 domain-containing protein n=1 Tax=Aquatica leii TaxID=1421715 RepID=A0AAN7PKM7_9COLE|nr:hypothetical protein RN001_006015 [Aquatica leii]